MSSKSAPSATAGCLDQRNPLADDGLDRAFGQRIEQLRQRLAIPGVFFGREGRRSAQEQDGRLAIWNEFEQDELVYDPLLDLDRLPVIAV